MTSLQLAMEWGYKACERGISYEQAQEEFGELMKK